MEDRQLQRSQKFEIAKNNIKTFSGKIPQNISLPKVQEDTWHGIWDRDVTGKEMNNLVVAVQDTFMKSNEVIKGIVKEFREVYTALDFLDKDYIQTFLVHIKAIEKNNEEITKANEEIFQAQKDINKTIQGLKITVSNLSEFKDSHRNDIENIHTALNTINDKTTELYENLEYSAELKNIFESYHHLKDIDNIWNDVQSHKTSLQALNKELSESHNSINIYVNELNTKVLDMSNYIETLQKIEHLHSIDNIHQSVQRHNDRLHQAENKIKNLYIIIGILALFFVGQLIFNFVK